MLPAMVGAGCALLGGGIKIPNSVVIFAFAAQPVCAVCATGVQQGPRAPLCAKPLDWVQLGEPTTQAHPLGPNDRLPAWICPEWCLNLGWSQLSGFVQFSSSSRCFPGAPLFFFQCHVAAVFYQLMRQQGPFWPLPLALVLVGGV